MTTLYFIIGSKNISAWYNNDLDEIDLDKVFSRSFDNPKEKQIFTEALYLIDTNIHNSSDTYLIIDEDEYNFLTT